MGAWLVEEWMSKLVLPTFFWYWLIFPISLAPWAWFMIKIRYPMIVDWIEVRRDFLGEDADKSQWAFGAQIANTIAVDFHGAALTFACVLATYDSIAAAGTKFDGVPEMERKAYPIMAAVASGVIVGWAFAFTVHRLVRRFTPQVVALRVLRGAVLSTSIESFSPPDPCGGQREAMVRLAVALDRCASRAEARLTTETTSAVASLFFGGAQYFRSYAGSKQSLLEPFAPDVRHSMGLVCVLLLDKPPSRIYEDALDRWQVYDEDGINNFPRRHRRFARVRQVFGSIGRGVEPTGRSVQVVLQVGVVIAIIALAFLGQIDIPAVIKKIIG
ncbi:hypothetical protein [Micromonospora sp. NPDC049282]|uniref:hypothetical protein n=1 Tax=Micromonospora sp. NPDC049282 TaxID=3364269 RepID=UPI003720C1AA